MARALEDARELVEEELSILGRLLLVPDPLVVVTLIERGVDCGTSRPVALDQPTFMRDQDTGPDAHPWIRTERSVRDLQHDAEHVLIRKEVVARPLEIVRSAHRVGEERVTAEPREEPEVAGRGDLGIGAKGDRGLLNDRLPG